MKTVKITPSLLSIPPYLSASWEHIGTLRIEPGTGVLIVTLTNGTQVEIPDLQPKEVDAIFEAHTLYSQSRPLQTSPMPFSLSLPLDTEGGVASIGHSMQHNADQSDLPDIPPKFLEKIAAIAKAFGLEESATLSPPVEGCNCTYCQIARSYSLAEEDLVSEADLSFKDWFIEQKGDKLFQVSSPLDTNERYNVFLGTPLGCTCGQKNCEHLKAVLRT
jgi:hypothetical protein